ncbi:MAG: thioredoxin [Acidimicrobiia bacterium]|nr:thioredoxin [Acidimicrobiia bacterium]
MSDNIITLTDADFSSNVASDKPVLVDFWAEWCVPCKVIAPILEDIADEHSEKLTIGKLNIDENPATPGSLDIMSIPTMIVFKNGTPVKRIVGARPRAAIEQELAEFIA